MRSVRCLSWPGVCSPRSISTASTGSGPRIAKAPGRAGAGTRASGWCGRGARIQRRRLSSPSALRISALVVIDDRLPGWSTGLQASRSEFRVSGTGRGRPLLLDQAAEARGSRHRSVRSFLLPCETGGFDHPCGWPGDGDLLGVHVNAGLFDRRVHPCREWTAAGTAPRSSNRASARSAGGGVGAGRFPRAVPGGPRPIPRSSWVRCPRRPRRSGPGSPAGSRGRQHAERVAVVTRARLASATRSPSALLTTIGSASSMMPRLIPEARRRRREPVAASGSRPSPPAPPRTGRP